MQRTLREQFYTRPLPYGVAATQQELERYLDYYHTSRPHMALGGLAPMEFLAQKRAVPSPGCIDRLHKELVAV